MAPDPLHAALTATSNVSLGFAVAAAQAAVLPRLPLLPRVQTLLVLVTNLWTRSFGATAALLALGMLPVVARTLRPGASERHRFTVGWAVCAGAGAAWAAGWAPAPWFDQTDLAHLVLMAGLAVVFTAVRDPSPGDRFDLPDVLVEASPSRSRPAPDLRASGGAEEHSWT